MIVPVKRESFFMFCTDHEQPWTVNATAIGTTAAAVTAWKTAFGEAAEAFNKASAMRDAAKAQTLLANQQFSASRQKTTDIVRSIKNFALTSGDDNVYVLAQIPEPTNPSTVPPPGQPFALTCDLDPNGQLTLRWRSDNPEGASGTFYTVKRRLGTGSGSFAILGGSGTRSYIDASIPAGTPRVVYIVNGQRGNSTGPASSEFTVNFGVGGDGAAFIAGTSSGGEQAGAMKMAA